jgi:hypothetical protein
VFGLYVFGAEFAPLFMAANKRSQRAMERRSGARRIIGLTGSTAFYRAPDDPNC